MKHSCFGFLRRIKIKIELNKYSLISLRFLLFQTALTRFFPFDSTVIYVLRTHITEVFRN